MPHSVQGPLVSGYSDGLTLWQNGVPLDLRLYVQNPTGDEIVNFPNFVTSVNKKNFRSKYGSCGFFLH